MEETFGGEEENDLESYKNIKERFEGNENALEICRLLLSNLSESQIQWEEKEEEKEKDATSSFNMRIMSTKVGMISLPLITLVGVPLEYIHYKSQNLVPIVWSSPKGVERKR
mmetsp:Transcript_13795/g.18985  ORF Transcript_13795/g.18985 Transcript_13795/m.18985 type:complete len:112 (+) Transcript_13795:23-358(+)